MDGVAIDGVQLLDEALLESVTGAAGRSQRRRMNLNLHDGDSDNPHRFFNVLLRGTYIPPHRHLNPPKPETFLLLRGSAAFFIFEDLQDRDYKCLPFNSSSLLDVDDLLSLHQFQIHWWCLAPVC